MKELMNYRIIRNNLRRRLNVTVTANEIVVRAPYRMSERQIRRFLEENREKIESLRQKQMAEAELTGTVSARLSDEELRKLKAEAKTYFGIKTAEYAADLAVSYGRITIRSQRTRWGSCSAKGNLNFNCLLMLAPEEVREAVIIHELCHRRHMDHSASFYREILAAMPDYRERMKWLKAYGAELIRRLPAGGG